MNEALFSAGSGPGWRRSGIAQLRVALRRTKALIGAPNIIGEEVGPGKGAVEMQAGPICTVTTTGLLPPACLLLHTQSCLIAYMPGIANHQMSQSLASGKGPRAFASDG